MLFLKRPKQIALVLVVLLRLAPKAGADENSQLSDISGGHVNYNPSVTLKTEDTKLDENCQPPVNTENKNGNSKSENSEPSAPLNNDGKSNNAKLEENDLPPEILESKPQNEKNEAGEQQSASREEKSEDTKSEELNVPLEPIESKKQGSKDDTEHKIDLNDVNAYTSDDNHEKATKREAPYTEFLGLPRDASYFFDDLEPFINNNSDSRVGRAAPSRDTKVQRSRFSGKGKENIDDVEEDDDDAESEEEEEKVNEEDYDDDEDVDSDCLPSTTTCSTPTTCKTTTNSPTTQTTTECVSLQTDKSTKCPKICVKANKRILNSSRKEPDCVWDGDKKKPRNDKRRNHSKLH